MGSRLALSSLTGALAASQLLSWAVVTVPGDLQAMLDCTLLRKLLLPLDLKEEQGSSKL